MACRIAERVKLEGGIEKFFEGGYASGWFFKVSDAFMGQLDIAETLKGATAGTCYSFEAGDIFYDSSAAYEMPWGEAVRAVSCALRVTDAVPSSIVVDEVRSEDGEAKSSSALQTAGSCLKSSGAARTGRWTFPRRAKWNATSLSSPGFCARASFRALAYFWAGASGRAPGGLPGNAARGLKVRAGRAESGRLGLGRG